MGKYLDLETTIFGVFNTPEWQAENITTIPANFVGNISGEFIRISVIPSGFGINPTSAAGVVIADIFASAGFGTQRFTIIADKLDKYLANKTLQSGNNSVQFANSSLTTVGLDGNASLYRYSYTIPFNYFGV